VGKSDLRQKGEQKGFEVRRKMARQGTIQRRKSRWGGEGGESLSNAGIQELRGETLLISFTVLRRRTGSLFVHEYVPINC